MSHDIIEFRPSKLLLLLLLLLLFLLLLFLLLFLRRVRLGLLRKGKTTDSPKILFSLVSTSRGFFY